MSDQNLTAQQPDNTQNKKKKKKKKKKKNTTLAVSADGKALPPLLCASCQQMRPRGMYSSKQLKNKGKRKCSECLAFISATNAANAPIPRAQLALLDAKGTSSVKMAKAEDIRRAQESAKGADAQHQDTDKFQVLQDWLRAGGAKYPDLLLKFYTTDYRGVHAKRRLDRNQCILEVPLALIMTTDKAQRCEIGRFIANSGATVHSSHSWLAAMLLQEKYNPNSYWKPYLDILPAHYRNMPIFFDQSELDELKGSFTLQMIANRKISLKMEYDAIANHCPEFARFHHLEFFWARLAVITRIFGFEIMGRKIDGLVPMADMLNHKRPHETAWNYSDSKGAFTITTTKRLLKGAQIFDSYGRKCNSRYFVNYGFALDVNEDNQVAMNFGLLPANLDPARAMKAAIVGARPRRFQIPFDHREQVTVDCLSYLRIVHATEEELAQLAEERADFKKVGPINQRNENAVCADLGRAAMVVLQGFPTTLEEDNKILSDNSSSLTMNIRNCVVMRRGEKEVLHAYTDLATRTQNWVNMTYPQFMRDFNHHIKNKGLEPSFEWRLETYVADIWKPFWTGEKVEYEVTSNAHVGS